MGFSDEQIDKSRPALNDRAAEAWWVWQLMGGWYPERLPVLLACVEIQYVDGLFDMLLVIRREMAGKAHGRSEDQDNGD